MHNFELEKLTRRQKLAVFLIVIGPESAAEVLRHFEDDEVEALCREMARVQVVPEEMRDEILAVFAPVVGRGAGGHLGGMDYARRTVELARGEHKAGLLLGRIEVGTEANSSELIAGITKMAGGQIANLLKGEQPQTVAYVLAHLPTAKAAEVFGLLPAEHGEDIMERLGTIDGTPRHLVGKIVRKLERHVGRVGSPVLQASGGAKVVADLLNQLEREASKGLLAGLERRNAVLGEAVRRELFGFEDLQRLPTEDLQQVLREVDSAHLATAMKSASPALREKVLGSLSKRAAEALADEITMLGPMRLKEVTGAQDAIVQMVRRMEEEGTIVLNENEVAMVA